MYSELPRASYAFPQTKDEWGYWTKSKL